MATFSYFVANFLLSLSRGGKRTHFLCLGKAADTLQHLIKAEILTQLPYSSKTNQVQVLKCSQSVEVKNIPSKDVFQPSCAKLTEPHIILIQCKDY